MDRLDFAANAGAECDLDNGEQCRLWRSTTSSVIAGKVCFQEAAKLVSTTEMVAQTYRYAIKQDMAE